MFDRWEKLVKDQKKRNAKKDRKDRNIDNSADEQITEKDQKKTLKTSRSAYFANS